MSIQESWPRSWVREVASVITESSLTSHKADTTTEKLFPKVEELVRTRSISEFQLLKRGLMDKAWKGKFGIGEYLLLSPIFPNLKEIDLACSRKWTLDEIWHIYEEPESEVSEIRPEHKILTLGQASEIFRKAESEEVRKGYVGGKWGLGAHREHLDLLSQAKAALGAGGKLIVGVESGEAIKDRRPGHHGIFSDAERLYRMAALSMVDAVVLLDPKPGQALEEYYLGIWRRLQPNIYFFGDKNYFWRPVLEKRAKETGVILLYARDANQITTTQLLEEITI